MAQIIYLVTNLDPFKFPSTVYRSQMIIEERKVERTLENGINGYPLDAR